MTFRELIVNGTECWSIPLSTHLGTALENETCSPNIAAKRLGRVAAEKSFAELWKQIRAPVSGYNCFGQVFASRRTALYQPDVELILSEDGFGEITSEDQYRVSDVVVYFDDLGPTHVARIVRFEPLLHVAGDEGSGVSRLEPWVLSKFDDLSGEYEHMLTDTRWDSGISGQITWKVFRDRHQFPRAKKTTTWRELVSG